VLILATTGQGGAAGDPDAGAQVFWTCAACHTLEPGVHRTGPSLAGVFGRKAGIAEGFHRYSDALRSADLVWQRSMECSHGTCTHLLDSTTQCER
jgi:cytochrome c